MSLLNLCRGYKTISIIGLGKNTGKTVALNHLLSEINKEKIPIGITSIGRDGEDMDLVYDIEKPKIHVEKGTLIATTMELIYISSANVSIIEKTDYTSPLGDIVISKVESSGDIQIAGPQSISAIKDVSNKMLNIGGEFVIVDGAIDRKSSAAPSISDATIMATGAILSPDMDKVIEDTLHQVEVFSLPVIEDKESRSIIEGLMAQNKIAIIDKDLKINPINLQTALGGGKVLGERLDHKSKYVVVPGSLVKNTIKDLIDTTKIYKDIDIVIKDGTKIFINSRDWMKFKKQGIKVKVLNPINLIGITINPYCPNGPSFEPREFLNKMRKSISHIPVMDLVLEKSERM